METINKPFYKKIAVVVSIIVIFAVFGVATYYYTITVPKNKLAKSNNAYYTSLLQNNPTVLQNSLVEDIKNGVNDMYTKSNAYFVTHRFFDNGGNIYEIYDYIESHPELAFLKEAEAIYPNIFDQIRKKTLPPTFGDRANHAYNAYLEILEKHGYADIAVLGTLANQYAKSAYFSKTISKRMSKEGAVYQTFYVPSDIKKSLEFVILAKQGIADIIDGTTTSKNVPARDILVGLNQYAAALRYLDGLGVNTSFSPKTSKEIFTFAMDYSHRFVPELNLFTSLLNASTLVISDSSDSSEVRAALYPILDLDIKKFELFNTSIIHKIIDARFEKKPERVSETNLDIYSRTNIATLGNRVPEFKTWLMANGWVEGDFQ